MDLYMLCSKTFVLIGIVDDIQRGSMRYKSAILTICDRGNYGNRLQNYALHTLLQQYGSCSTIAMPTGVVKRDNIAIRVCKKAKQGLKAIYGSLFRDNRALRYRRLKKCSSMTDALISGGSFVVTDCDGFTSYGKDTYDTLVIGSDQVWNYLWLTTHELELRLGAFALPEHPVISYAASFGISEVDDNVKPIFQKYLPRLKSISVREDRGAELVKEMTGLDATVVLDPTLMLSADKWLEITQGFVSEGDRYVLTYFLGEPSDEQERAIRLYARNHGCRIRRMLDPRDKETYVVATQDFVELFSKAQYVFTDSYHACCFSILFHKQFTVFNRAGMDGKASMNSRMETLFRLFELDSVMIDSGLAPEIDYGKVDRLLEQRRKESQVWLDKAMES